MKIQRVNRLFKSGFSRWLVESYDILLSEPIKLWVRLVRDLNTGMYKKTIVFAMKVFDIVNLIVNNEYLSFPRDIPIPVDFHTRNMALSSGIIEEYTSDEEVRQAWNQVSEKVSNLLGKNVNPLRIDSIAWQIGKIAYKNKFDKENTTKEIIDYLRSLDISGDMAEIISQEFTRYINRVFNT